MKQDAEEYEGEEGELIEIPLQVSVPAGFVAIPQEDYEAMIGAMQRLYILMERIRSGERLTKSLLLRACGAFDEANAEEMYELQQKGKKV